MKFSVFSAFFLTAILLSGCSHTLYIEKDFKASKLNIDKATIIFPELEFAEKDGETKEIRAPHSVYISRTAAEAIKEIINEGNFSIKHAVVFCDTPLIGKWIQNQFSDAAVKFKQLHEAIGQSKDNKRILPQNDELRSLIKKANDEYVIIITGSGYGTNEQSERNDIQQLKAFDLLSDQTFPYNYQLNGLQLQVTLVDAKSMQILWYNYNPENDSKYNPFNKEEVKSLCMKLMNPK